VTKLALINLRTIQALLKNKNFSAENATTPMDDRYIRPQKSNSLRPSGYDPVK